MKERPMLFSGPMVRAILNGSKTQTRRIIKPYPSLIPDDCLSVGDQKGRSYWVKMRSVGLMVRCIGEAIEHLCPHGLPGDRLWVKETFSKNGVLPLQDRASGDFIYRADLNERGVSKWAATWKPSIHMPRGASRITLGIIVVGVERLKSIREEDAIAEGIEREYAHGIDIGWKNYLWHGHFGKYGTGNRQSDMWEYQYSTYENDNAVGCFSSMWESINGPGSWDLNPWVWVIEFRRLIS